MEKTISILSCGNCCNQDVSSLNNNATQKDQPLRNYPDSKVDNIEAPEGKDCPENILMPGIQTNDWSATVVKFAFANRKGGKWNNTECHEYFATMGIAEKILDNIKSKIRIEIELPNVNYNIADLYPYLWQTND